MNRHIFNHFLSYSNFSKMKMESLMVVFCSKLNLSIKDFVDVVRQLRCTANSLGVALENLSRCVNSDLILV